MSPRVQAGAERAGAACCGLVFMDPCEDCPRVQSGSQRDAARPEFGSTPHDDRVLAIVLVMPEGVPAPDVRVVRVEPNTPHGEAFWQDAGRPVEGHEESAEATASDECVQRACPTPPVIQWGTSAHAPSVARARVAAQRCNSFWEAESHDREVAARHRALRRAAHEWHAREDLIERLGPLPEPIPRREP